jgi:hypothetical protein
MRSAGQFLAPSYCAVGVFGLHFLHEKAKRLGLLGQISHGLG